MKDTDYVCSGSDVREGPGGGDCQRCGRHLSNAWISSYGKAHASDEPDCGCGGSFHKASCPARRAPWFTARPAERPCPSRPTPDIVARYERERYAEIFAHEHHPMNAETAAALHEELRLLRAVGEELEEKRERVTYVDSAGRAAAFRFARPSADDAMAITVYANTLPRAKRTVCAECGEDWKTGEEMGPMRCATCGGKRWVLR